MASQISFILLISMASISRGGDFGQAHVRVDCFKHPFINSTEFSCEAETSCNPKFEFRLMDSIYSTYGYKSYEKSFSYVQTLGACSDRSYSNFPAYINLTVTRPRSKLYLLVKITERNVFNSDDLIEEMIFQLIPGIKTVYGDMDLKTAMMPLNVSVREYSHLFPSTFLNLSAVFSCGPYRYGSRCNVICKPTTQYTCSGNGRSRICKPGWSGVYCNEVDHCSSFPCKKWATCTNSGSTFKCTCNGRSGKQCQKGMDPCIEHQCKNGAICIDENDHPKCVCSAGWIGYHCQIRDPCIKYDECAPNGKCKVFVDEVFGTYKPLCDCSSGFKGKYCKESVTGGISNQTLTIVIVVISVVAVFLIGLSIVITIICFMRRQKKKRQKQKLKIEHGNLTYLTRVNDTESRHSEEYEDPDNVFEFDSNVYADPGAVYSCDSETGNDKMDEYETTTLPDNSTVVANSNNLYCQVTSGAPSVRYIRFTQP